MSTQLAVQLYTLRDYLKTPADIAKTCKKLADQGWKAVQNSALGPIDAKELKKIFDDNGLACVATHQSLDGLKNVDKVLEEHALWNCKYTAIGGFFPKAEDFTKANWQKFTQDFNDVVKLYEGKPLKIGYHNHSHEWIKFGPELEETTIMESLVQNMHPATWFEIDTYWVAHGGGNPAAWIKRLKGRVPVLHFKDIGIKLDKSHYMMEVGEGNLDWPGIIAAAKEAGTEIYCVEQDTCYRDPFDSLKTSLENLKSWGLS